MLNRDDQRRLDQIEQDLELTDPKLARRLRTRAPHRCAQRVLVAYVAISAAGIVVAAGWELGVLAALLMVVVLSSMLSVGWIVARGWYRGGPAR